MLITASAALAAGTLSAPAVARPPETGCSPISSFVFCDVDGSTKEPGSGGRPGERGKPGKKPLHTDCIVKRMDPQPPASSDVWAGHKPGDGAIYTRICIGAVVGGAMGGIGALPPFQTFWSDTTPAPKVDPRVLAREAVDSMLLTGPKIASPRAAGKYTVGVPMWMWVDPSTTTFGPNTASATLAGVTVSATAKVSSIRWSMGDGKTVACQGAGTKYKASYGMAKSPDCGHFYRTSSKEQADGRFKGTATATWAVDWQVTGGGGEEGAFTEVRESGFEVSVGEMRVLD